MPSHNLSKSVVLEKTPSTVQKIATSHTDVTEILYNFGNVHNHGQTPRSLTDFPSHILSSPFAVPVHTLQSPIYTYSSPSTVPSC
jgi:hypothetical protein